MSKKKNNKNNSGGGGGGSNKQKQAVQRAQAFVSGNTLNRSEIKKLEDKGFSSKVIRAVAASAPKVGSKAQDHVEQKHAPGSGGGGRTVRVIGGDGKVKVDGQGQLVVSSPRDRFGTPAQFGVTQKQADKVNKKVEKVGGSLKPGPGMAVSRYVTIRTPAVRNPLANKGGGADITPSGRKQLAIYAPVSQPDAGGGGGGRSGGGGGGQRSARDRERMSSARSAYERAQAHISGNSSVGRPPEMYPGGTTPDRAIEDVANYADRLGAYNANYSGWMQDRAEADRYRSGAMLERMANILPKAPDVFSGKDMIDMANRMNRRIDFG